MILTGRRQHRMLTAIQSGLRTSDPRLVASFMTFTRLTRHEAIPAVERMRRGPARWLWPARRSVPSRELRQGILFLPLLALAMLAVVLVLAVGQSRASCTPRQTAAGTHGVARLTCAQRSATDLANLPLGR